MKHLTQQGMTLLETIIVTGLVGLLALFSSGLLIQFEMVNSEQNRDLMIRSMLSEVRMLMSSKESCFQTLATGLAKNPVIGTNFTDIIQSGTPPSVAYTTGTTYGHGTSAIQFNNFRIQDFQQLGIEAGGYKEGVARLMVRVSIPSKNSTEKCSKINGQLLAGNCVLDYFHPVSVRLNSSNNINACGELIVDAELDEACTGALGGTYQGGKCFDLNTQGTLNVATNSTADRNFNAGNGTSIGTISRANQSLVVTGGNLNVVNTLTTLGLNGNATINSTGAFALPANTARTSTWFCASGGCRQISPISCGGGNFIVSISNMGASSCGTQL